MLLKRKMSDSQLSATITEKIIKIANFSFIMVFGYKKWAILKFYTKWAISIFPIKWAISKFPTKWVILKFPIKWTISKFHPKWAILKFWRLFLMKSEF